MDITNHAKERYLERIKDIKDKQEIKRLMVTDDGRITKEINKLYEYSELIFRGQIGGENATKDFRMNGDICLVVDEHCIRTIYRINFAFPEKTRLKVINDLKEEIQALQIEISNEQKEVSIKDADCDCYIKQIKLEINELNEMLVSKSNEIEMYQAIKKANRNKLRQLNSTLQIYAEQLLGNTQYKKDIV